MCSEFKIFAGVLSRIVRDESKIERRHLIRERVIPVLPNIPEGEELKLDALTDDDNEYIDADASEDSPTYSHPGLSLEWPLPEILTTSSVDKIGAAIPVNSVVCPAPNPVELRDRPAFEIFADPVRSNGEGSTSITASLHPHDDITNKPGRHLNTSNVNKMAGKENLASSSALRNDNSAVKVKGCDGVSLTKGRLQSSKSLHTRPSEAT